MKKAFLFLVVLMMVLPGAGMAVDAVSSATVNITEVPEPIAHENARILVIWFSTDDTVKAVALTVADALDADSFELVPVQPYTEADLAYYRVMQSELAAASQKQQALSSMPALTGYAGQFLRGKTYEVYRGPGRDYGRSANGKASVSTNDTIWIYGVRGGWMLISYGISGGHTRYGWISTAGLPESMLEYCPELVFPGDEGTDYVYATITDATSMTDLEAITDTIVSQVGLGASVHCLAVRPGWVLAEMYRDGNRFMGFIPQNCVDTKHGRSNHAQFTYPDNPWHPVEEIRAAALAIAGYYAARAAGHTLLRLYYLTDENLPENAVWPTDVPKGIEWMKLYGTARSISYYDFEIAGSDGTAEDLAFYVWREPGGEWIGGMGGYE